MNKRKNARQMGRSALLRRGVISISIHNIVFLQTKPLSHRGQGFELCGDEIAFVPSSFQRGHGEPNLGGRPGSGMIPLQLRDSAGLLKIHTGFAFKPSHPGDMAPMLENIQL
jgi:hypothetical protein